MQKCFALHVNCKNTVDKVEVNTMCPYCNATDITKVRRVETCTECGGRGSYQSGPNKDKPCENCSGKGGKLVWRMFCKKCEMVWVPENE